MTSTQPNLMTRSVWVRTQAYIPHEVITLPTPITISNEPMVALVSVHAKLANISASPDDTIRYTRACRQTTCVIR